jgi:predicted hydrocarbon binding protein
LEHRPKAEIPYYFAPGKKLFQIVANVRGEPGAVGSIIGLLEARFKLVGVTSNALPDNTNLLNMVAEAQSDTETTANIRSIIMANAAALDVEVLEGREGILVDKFHTGLATGAGYVMMFRRQSITKMLDRINRLLGTGGEVVLFEEGIAVGKANGEGFLKSLGAEKVRKNIDYLRSNLTAQGWGEVSVEMEPDGVTRRMVVQDCFECSSNDGGRTGCHFFRGYILGNTSATFGKPFKVEEVECRLKGGDRCAFIVNPIGRAGSREASPGS